MESMIECLTKYFDMLNGYDPASRTFTGSNPFPSLGS